MKKLFLFFLAATVLSGLMLAQVEYPGIYGTVVLPDGSTIPGVTVILSESSGVKLTTVTSEDGNFRFLRNAPGEYELRFELEGFKTVIRKGIRLYLGKNVNINVPMETTTIKEEVIVTAKANPIDVRKTSVSSNVTSEQINTLPSARNAWTLLNLVPGMMVDRVDVGGAESGQQSSFAGLGGSSTDAVWNIDGGNMTDISATGSAPAYLDVSAYDEMQVTLGANDISAQTGGVQINFVTKKTGNRITGDFHLYTQQKAWEMDQTLPPNLLALGRVPPGINRLMQYGTSLGGPIIKDKLWWVGSYGIQDIKARTMPGREDTTWLVSGYIKTNFQLGNTSGDFHLTYDDKQKFGRTTLDPSQQADGTLWDQVTPGWVYFGSLQQIMGNLMLNAKLMYTDGGFSLNPRGSSLNAEGYETGAYAIRYSSPLYMVGTYNDYFTNRNNINPSLNGNYYAENVLGADHEIRFGVDFVNASTTTQSLFSNGINRVRIQYQDPARNTADWHKQLWFAQDYIVDVKFKRNSFYLSDSATYGKLTVNLGLRYDQEYGISNPFTRHALKLNGTTPILNQYMGEFVAKEITSPKFNTISPRLSFAYDFGGDGKTVAKLALARYGSQTGNGLIGMATKGYVGWKEMDFYWNDDGDNVPELGEWDDNAYTYVSFDPANPNPSDITSLFADGFKSPQLDELTLSIERQIADDMVFQVAGYYKKNSKQIIALNYYGSKTNYTVDTFDNWEVIDTLDLEGTPVDIYEHKAEYAYGNGTYFRNAKKGTYDRYLALQLMFSKKLSHKWMADLSLTLQDHKQYWEKDDWIGANWWNLIGGSPNSYDYYNGGVVAPESGGSGYSEYFMQSRWMINASFMVQLPLDINLSAVLNAREGYPTQHYKYYSTPYSGEIKLRSSSKKFGDDRLDPIYTLNLALEKVFKISDTASATFFVDGYNIMNAGTTLKIDGDIESDNFKAPLRIINPGIFQFGVRVKFQ
jgi:hypothetical protein